ncbi:hypothetical protein ACOSQ2_026250 [Xanthoceras sorbifolium]
MQQQVEKAALVFSLKLDNGHKLLCLWINNACDETLAQFPPTPPPVLVDKFREPYICLEESAKKLQTRKDLKQLPEDNRMKFDLIRQHRHFLDHLDGNKHYLLYNVDDPIAAFRKLFTSPVTKRMKTYRESN